MTLKTESFSNVEPNLGDKIIVQVVKRSPVSAEKPVPMWVFPEKPDRVAAEKPDPVSEEKPNPFFSAKTGSELCYKTSRPFLIRAAHSQCPFWDTNSRRKQRFLGYLIMWYKL